MCCGQPVNKSSISCAMIVRDAEKTLATALNSVAGHVDEIVIVDTGSVDTTKQVAWRFNTQVYDLPWCDDFSAARQFAHDLCSGEWVFFLDADDEVFGADQLRRLVAMAPADIDIFMLRYVLARDAAGTPVTEFYRERLVRKEKMRWEGRVHEVMVPTAGHCNQQRFDTTWVLHHGHGDPVGSLQRNIRLLELDLAARPDQLRSMFYLGRDYVQLGLYQEGIDMLERYLDTAEWLDERFMALTMIGHAHRVMGHFNDAYASDARMLLTQPQWPQTWFMLAQDAYYLQLWSTSVMYCEIGQGLPAPTSDLFISPTELESGWMIYQVVALCKCDRLEEAINLTERALALLPDHIQHQQNAAFFQKLVAERAAGKEVVHAG